MSLLPQRRKQLIIQLVLLIAICVLVPLVFHAWLESLRPSKTTLPDNLPDSYMENATYREYDASGLLHSYVATPSAIHYTRQDTTQFTRPHILLYTKNRSVWYIDADQGQSIQGHREIHLTGHVIIRQPSQTNKPETLITTTAITYYPDTMLAKTDQLVRLQYGPSEVQGKGLIANFKTNVIQLLSQSRGIYVPNR
jgi:lipopolysaccharide export system protein LptC